MSDFFRVEGFQKSTALNTTAEKPGTALAFEKATLLFYQALKESDGKSGQIKAIINTEKSHIFSLSRIFVTEAEFRGIEDKWQAIKKLQFLSLFLF